MYEEQIEQLTKLLKDNSSAKQTFVSRGTLRDATIYVRFDALETKDYPHNINDNSKFLEYSIDLLNKKVKLFLIGRVYLSPSDKETDKYRYLCMKSIENVLVDYGGKKFRKQGFKTIEELYNKMENHYKEVMESVTRYTGGYPYFEGK